MLLQRCKRRTTGVKPFYTIIVFSIWLSKKVLTILQNGASSVDMETQEPTTFKQQRKCGRFSRNMHLIGLCKLARLNPKE